MFREKYGLPPLSPEEHIERLIRDEVHGQPVNKHWDRSTTYLLIGAISIMLGLSYILGVTPAAVWENLVDLARNMPDLTSMPSL